MARGGQRTGAGRPPAPKEQKCKRRSVYLTDEEYDIIRAHIRELHQKKDKAPT